MPNEEHMSTATTPSIQVALRIRSVNDFEDNQPHDCLKFVGNTVRVVPHNKLFTFDHVFGPTTPQNDIFEALGVKLVHKFAQGFNVTVLAYGQTSSGKTYTMGTAQPDDRSDKTDEGIVPRAMVYLFDLLHQRMDKSSSTGTTSTPLEQSMASSSTLSTTSAESPAFKYTVKVSFIEIHNEQLNDLLNDAPATERPSISIREDAKGQIHCVGVKEMNVCNANDVLYYLEQGTKHRATGATGMNDKSSRSHAILSVTLQQEQPRSTGTSQSGTSSPRNNGVITTSKFHFVDLAGSERLKQTATEGNQRKEGININAGLHALGNVLSALGDLSRRDKHVPYRDSKLTRLLRDSLGGNATTLMIACANSIHVAETLNTLQFANRALNIKPRSERNQDWKTTNNLKLLRSLVRKLKKQVVELTDNNASYSAALNNQSFGMLCGKVETTLGTDISPELDISHVTTANSESTIEKVVIMPLNLGSVIEDYEQGIATLVSELGASNAAYSHQTLELERLHVKYNHLQQSYDDQDKAMTELHHRLTKTIDQEHNNIAYIEELESKLKQAIFDAAQDKSALEEHRNKMARWKEDGKTTELYIQSLEQQLATSEEQHNRLTSNLETLKLESCDKDNTILDLQQQLLGAIEKGFSQQKSLLEQLDILGKKYAQLQVERDTLQAPQNPPPDPLLKMYLEQLDPNQTMVELDSILEHYHDTLEQLEYLDHTSVMESTRPSLSLNPVLQPPLSPTTDSDDDGCCNVSGLATPTGSIDGGYLDQELGRALDYEDRSKLASLEDKVKSIQDVLEHVTKQDDTYDGGRALQLDELTEWKKIAMEEHRVTRAALEKLEKDQQLIVNQLGWYQEQPYYQSLTPYCHHPMSHSMAPENETNRQQQQETNNNEMSIRYVQNPTGNYTTDTCFIGRQLTCVHDRNQHHHPNAPTPLFMESSSPLFSTKKAIFSLQDDAVGNHHLTQTMSLMAQQMDQLVKDVGDKEKIIQQQAARIQLLESIKAK
ncbi:P-loop containing nucleoside triphosphate hydrolase protein [Chlamydoabsidia padenii]|nr:P-loop containing nucleoside triphosphate hydrolase protein [Chlamydoabsidia padenii]